MGVKRYFLVFLLQFEFMKCESYKELGVGLFGHPRPPLPTVDPHILLLATGYLNNITAHVTLVCYFNSKNKSKSFFAIFLKS